MYIDEVELYLDEFKENSKKCINHLKDELSSIRAGRANPHILDKVMVSYYGQMTPLNQMGNITVPEARMLCISLWDQSARAEVIKAINASDIGINPTDDGKVIRLVFPVLTEERRRELCKDVRKYGEEAKITIRNERRDCLDGVKKLKNDKLVTEDDQVMIEKDVQKLIDGFTGEIESAIEAKEKEILTI